MKSGNNPITRRPRPMAIETTSKLLFSIKLINGVKCNFSAIKQRGTKERERRLLKKKKYVIVFRFPW